MAEHAHSHDDHGHTHPTAALTAGARGGHGHTHGTVDPSLLATSQGVRAVQVSLLGMLATALIQVVVVVATGSVALLADTIHNLGDAMTAVPLWAAFVLGARPPTARYTYGLGRAEDLAGVVVVLIILASAIAAAMESLARLANPEPVTHLEVVAFAGLVGFAGNEMVALYRVRVGKQIGSAALVADGYHARADGLTSLAVVAGAAGVALGVPQADPIVGLIISLFILRIVWQAGGQVLRRLLDGVDPDVVGEVLQALQATEGVQEVTEVRVRWLGHRMQAEVNLAVDPLLTVAQAHTIAEAAEHELLHRLPYLSAATIHIDPADASGEAHHRTGEHQHGDEPAHRH